MELKGTQWIISARPTKIDEVYGGVSSNIDTMLKPFVKLHAKDDQWPNGILLMGKSGGGKTTIAKIIAQTIACRHKDENGNPCEVCPDCKAIINDTYSRDVKFFNAADLSAYGDTAPDAMRNIVKMSKGTTFFGGGRRVFIIDEVQEILRGSMKASINTILEELENPKSKTVWIFTSMDTIKASGSTIETELGNGNGYGSSGATGFLRRVKDATFLFKPLTSSDLILYLANFCKTQIYEGEKTIWKYLFEVLDESTKTFLTEGFKLIAEGSLGSIGMALANLQYCIENKVFKLNDISKYVGVAPETELKDMIMSIAYNKKDDNAFEQISGISNQNFPTIFQLMMSDIRRAEQIRVFNKIGNIKAKDETLQVITEKSNEFGETIMLNKAKQLLAGPNYVKLKETLLKLNQEGFFNCDVFKIALLNCFS